MNQEGTKRKLVAILSADVKEYSRLMSQDERGTIRTLTAYKEAMSSLIEEYKGRVVDAPGDNLLAEFGSVVDAVNCAVEIQRELAERNAELPYSRRMEFRIGINLGDIVVEEKKIYGDGVNIAARVESLAEGGGICISGTAYDHVENKLGLEYEYLGEQEVKNIRKPVRVYRVRMEPVTTQTGSVKHLELPDKPSIAVLPFDNLSGDPDQEYFSDGITEEVITALSKIPKLFVIARHSTFAYKGKPVRVQQVAEEVGVQYVLEGSVRKSEERVRITAQLIDALKGHHLWAERYDRTVKDMFAVQDEIAKNIITALQVELTEGEQARVYAKDTDNLEAFLKVMEANWLSSQTAKQGVMKARQLAEEAISLDPNYAYPYYLLGRAHMVDMWLGLSKSPRESLKRAIAVIRKAIALDDSLAIAHAMLGYLLVMARQYDKAIPQGEKAIALEPNAADVLQCHAAILTFVGRREEAIHLFKEALRLNPKPPNLYYRHFGVALRDSGQYEEAIALQKKAIAQEPNDILAHLVLTSSYSLAGRDAEARAAAQEVLRINPKFSVTRMQKVSPHKDRAFAKRWCDALRKAGLK
jgi:adenylate cyclase